MKSSSCKFCESSKIMENISIVDFSHANKKKELSVEIQTTDRILFNKFKNGKLKAQICGSCGHVDLKVTNAKELWEAYIKQK